MKKEINIPLNVIADIAINIAGSCVTLSLDRSLSKNVDNGKIANYIGRFATSFMTGMFFANLGSAVMDMEFLNIRVPIGKSKDDESNDEESEKFYVVRDKKSM